MLQLRNFPQPGLSSREQAIRIVTWTWEFSVRATSLVSPLWSQAIVVSVFLSILHCVTFTPRARFEEVRSLLTECQTSSQGPKWYSLDVWPRSVIPHFRFQAIPLSWNCAYPYQSSSGALSRTFPLRSRCEWPHVYIRSCPPLLFLA